ncbi:diguanylate cyclase [Salinivibrio sp. YCSC6]|uniref:GGDEF domain-containing protein n=1 Tax=Salinivibrio sp. YCSC6 TaxID=2003370 RepID=UPI000BBC70F5|nr:GGDEF domain-containing protein [Salinivibrio sp. YCSC6]PCE69051.1 GGDEF domain-containing protein [Salinivibrio sp. YCSC6]QCF36521.1 diguanylate cyclase [Salinivibrio sp. YCSC6]
MNKSNPQPVTAGTASAVQEDTPYAYRDLALKSRREIHILKRLVTRFVATCTGKSSLLDKKLAEFRELLHVTQDVSPLIPRLAIIERMVGQHDMTQKKAESHLSAQFHASGETLKRVPGLPAQLKRDLRDLLSQPADDQTTRTQQLVKLLQLYERAVTLQAVRPGARHSETTLEQDQIRRVADELQNLITELDLDGEAGRRLLDIRQQLLDALSPATIIALTLESLKLILEATHAERRASQAFLAQVNDNLIAISQQNTRAYDHAHSLRQDHQRIDTLLGGTIANIERDLSAPSADATALSRSLAHALADLKALADENEALKNREQSLVEQLAHNQNQLNAVAEQTMDQRRRLGDQERKLLLDPLTRVYNRAALHDRLEHEYRLWRKYQHDFCLAVIDIDHFKEVNVQFGHLVGDKALKIIARSIYQCLRDTDFIARFGGEEFVVLLPDADEKTRTDILANVSHTIRQLPLKFKNQRVSITASIGATLFSGSDTPTHVLERADQALYQAKNAGRNQIIWC